MSTPYESGRLILKLFELRRDPLLREARDWFIGSFHPDSVEDVLTVLGSDDNSKYRMVVGYWDMAASLVGHGAVDRQMFLDANPEVFATFSKIHHLLDDLRGVTGNPDYLRHLEEAVLSAPGMEERLEALRQELSSLEEAED